MTLKITKLKVLAAILLQLCSTIAAAEVKVALMSPESARPSKEAKTSASIVEKSESAPRALKNKKHSSKSTKKTSKKTSKKIEDENSSTAEQVKNTVVFEEGSVSKLAKKIERRTRFVEQQKKNKLSQQRKLLRAFELSTKDMRTLKAVKDEELAKESLKVQALMKSVYPVLARQLSGKISRPYASVLEAVKKRLLKMIRKQIASYKLWQKKSWEKIEGVLKKRKPLLIRKKELNRSENEKLYQLFIVEDSEKRMYLLPIIEVETRLVDVISRKVAELLNEKYVRLAVDIMNKQLFLEFTRRFKKYQKLYKEEYLKGIYAMDDEYALSWKQNEDFVTVAE